MSQQQFYSDEEAQRLLHLAAQNTPTTGMSRDELIRAASEMGIPVERVEEAEAHLQTEREAKAKEEEEVVLRRDFQRHFRNKQLANLWGFLSANSIFIFVWAFTGMGYFWPIWIFGWWGVALVGELFGSLFNPAYKERAYEKWLAKKRGEPVVDDEETSQVYETGFLCRSRARRRRHRYW